MAIAIIEEHEQLSRVARSFLEGHGARAANRALLEADGEQLPPFWRELTELGWTGLHLPEKFGGSGFGLPELAVIVEELGYAVAPGPYLPTVWASSLIDSLAGEGVQEALLPGLADGSVIGAVGLGGSLARKDGSVEGSAGLVLGAGLADVLLLATGDDMVVIARDQPGVSIDIPANIDPSRRVGMVTCTGATVAPERVLTGAFGTALRLGRILAAAEASGAAHACSEMAAEYAKVRQQFGRIIGTFQAIKHHCANMHVDAEQATAAAWDAARADAGDRQAEMAAAAAAAVTLPALARCCQLNTQVHGGIGFTWEHDAHLYMRRSGALSAIFSADDALEDVTRLAAQGVKRLYDVDLPPEAEQHRSQVKSFIRSYQSVPEDQRRKVLADSGYLVPHWPKPWGREAGPVEQLVIDQEFTAAAVEVPELGISGWNTLTIAQHGTSEQLERWIQPSLDGEIEFCQLFSEPNAGSDAAGIQTRGKKVDGGWLVNGQKVWTSGAHLCNRGFATIRTDPDAPKHSGITMMVIDMHADGVDVRPLRQITGESNFNEVFFDDVFVPDNDVVGPVNGGWTVARATLGNERVSIGGRSDRGGLVTLALELMQKHAPDDRGIARDLGVAICVENAMQLLNLRRVVRAVAGAEPGREGNVTKLLGSENGQRTATLMARIVGTEAAACEGPGGVGAMLLLDSRGRSIAGGTSEIVRNQIAERILGLPRDPLLK